MVELAITRLDGSGTPLAAMRLGVSQARRGHMLEGFRVILLFGVVGTVVLSTALFRAAGRPLIDWYVRVFRFPEPLRKLLASDRVVRIWGLASSVLTLVAWWYLGTPEGEVAFRAFAPRAMP